MALDFSKPFYVCTTLQNDLTDSDSTDDQHFFETYVEAKVVYEELILDSKKYVWFAEIGFHELDSGRLAADWMYFRISKDEIWNNLKVVNSQREYRGNGIPEESGWGYVAHYKILDIEDLRKP